MSELLAIGDRLQSEASRIADYLSEQDAPYEVAMAVIGVRVAVDDWTAARIAEIDAQSTAGNGMSPS